MLSPKLQPCSVCLIDLGLPTRRKIPNSWTHFGFQVVLVTFKFRQLMLTYNVNVGLKYTNIQENNLYIAIIM